MKLEKEKILQVLKDYKKNCKYKEQIIDLGLFGSYAKNLSSTQSDIDVFVTLKKSRMFDLIGIKQDLEEIFDCKVDIVILREKMNPILMKEIINTGIHVR